MTEKPREVSIPAIRELLLAAFSAETLDRFCQDRPLFQPVLVRFGPRHGLDDMVDEVIDYCQTQLLWDELLGEVQKANPRQYARFEDRLYEDHVPTGIDPAVATRPSSVPAGARTKWPWEAPRPAWFWPAVGGAAVVLVVILALALWPPPPEPMVTPTAAPATKASDPPASPGPTEELVAVPEMQGELCRWVASDLEKANLRLDGELSFEVNSEISFNNVIRTDPPAGAQVKRDSDVRVVCSLGPMRPVPNVVEFSKWDAQEELENCDREPCFETRLEYERTGDLAEGYVIWTDPPAGAVVNPGSVVTLCLSLPLAKARVPNVTNMSVEEASARLASSDLEVGEIIRETSATVTRTRVIRCEPPSGETVDAESSVVLVVSDGPEAVIVPNLVEQTWEAALEELEGLGLQAVKSDERYHDDSAAGNVIETDPYAGKSVVPGYEIKLVVSLGLDPDGDRDNDGMPNGWEADHGLDPRVNDASSDPDRDELPNLTEYENQTDPWNADFPSIRVVLRYRGERLSSVTSATPSIEVWLGNPGQPLVQQDLPTVYDDKVGEFTVFNAPAGEYRIHVEIDVDGNGYPRAGDLRSELEVFNVSSDQETVRGDIDLDSIIHLTEPVDNAFAIRRHDWQTFDLYDRDELLFRWDSVAGATSYLIRIGEWRYTPTRMQLGEVVNTRTEQTSYRADLPSSSSGRYYWFIVHAYTYSNDYLGGLYIEYSCSPGIEKAGYEFRVR